MGSKAWPAVAAVLLGLTVWGAPCRGEDVIGAVEDVLMLPSGIRLAARIDTGAATSSLDAKHISIRDGVVEVTLSARHGGHVFRLPVKRIVRIKSASGRQQRPVVALTICLGSQQMTVEANLTDRSHLPYPLLVGRNVLEKGFVVDVRKMRKLPPDCSVMPKP